jgi:hypothetical protein
MVIKTFQSPQKGDVSYVLRKPLTKNMTQPPFLVTKKIQSPFDNGGLSDGDQFFFVTIRHTCTID